MVWNWLQYIVGFQKLGHDVYFIEEVKSDWAKDSRGIRCDFNQSENQRLFRATMEQFGLMEKACQIYDAGRSTFGLSVQSLTSIAKQADLLINMSGHVHADFVLENAKRRVYFDQDPVFTQLWAAEYGKDLNFQNHDVFFTVGLNIGTAHTTIPDCGVTWQQMLPPVLLDHWPSRAVVPSKSFTTIASWSSYGDVCYAGEWYQSKYTEFERFAELPKRSAAEFEVALKSYRENDAGIQLLKDNGWHVSATNKLSDLESYQNYIAQSRAEIGIAKNAYVKGNSGWFSERSGQYLASGRPVLAQSTGFERLLPTGEGLLTFTSMEEAVKGVDAINRDYNRHCQAAREFAAEYLDSNKVLSQMLERSMALSTTEVKHA
jgi:hypothetical protein